MNLISVLGLISAIVFFYAGLKMTTDNMHLFWDHAGFFIVVGGTLAAAAVSYQLDRLFMLFKIFVNRIIRGKKYNYAGIIKEIMTVAEMYRQSNDLPGQVSKVTDPFFRETMTLICDNIVDKEHAFKLLKKRSENIYFHYMEDSNKIKNLAKFPPALGIMGTAVGMIVLLSNLGGADAIKKVGPAMGVCLTATLYGVALANLVLIPIGENLTDSSKEVYLKNKIVIEGMKLILEKTNPIVLAEELNSFLLPDQRLDWKKSAAK